MKFSWNPDIVDYRQGKAVKTILIFALVVLIGFFLRYEYTRVTIIPHPVIKDAKEYVNYGYHIFHHGTFSIAAPDSTPVPDSYRSPGYPLLVALAFLVGNDQSFYPYLLDIQLILSTLTIVLTFLSGRRFLSFRASAVAAFLVALSPHLIAIQAYILTETLFCFWLASGVAAFVWMDRVRGGQLPATGGIAFGCAYLTNETALLVPILLAAVAILFARHMSFSGVRRAMYIKILFFLFTFAVFPFAWSVRNALNVPPEAPSAKGRAVKALSHGAYPYFIHKSPAMKRFPYREDPAQPAFGASMPDFWRIFSRRVKERPLLYAGWYLFGKPYYLWQWDILQGVGDIYIYPVKRSYYGQSVLAGITKHMMQRLHSPMLIVSLGGFFLFFLFCRKSLEKDCLPVSVLFSLLGYYTLMYTIFAPWPRYSIPLRPLLYLWSVWSFVFGIGLIVKKCTRAKLHFFE